MGFAIQDGESMVLIGDSITDCGRRGAEAPFGNGYVKLFIDLVTARHPERNIRFTNMGIGGNKVTDLRDRWEDDVIRHKPDWLSVKIGINDLHSYVRDAQTGVGVDHFRSTYSEILERAKTALSCRLILIDPFYISTDRSGQSWCSRVLDALPAYIEVVHELAQAYDARLIQTHDLFSEQLRYRDPGRFCPEPVHPNLSGHMVIANALYDVLDE